VPFVVVNGIKTRYLDEGAGEVVLLIAGTGSSADVWRMHQFPAFVAAGYRVIAYDNRGIGPVGEWTEGLEGFTVDDLARDAAGVIEKLGLGPVRVLGTSMGAYVAQELALARPDLVRQAVFMASRARGDAARKALALAEAALYDSGAGLPASYRAVVRALQMLSPRTLNDDQNIRDWLDLLELAPPDGPGVRAQLALEPMPDRRAAYRAITVPCQVISFEHDLITPPHAGEELAGLLPGAGFELVPDAGHYGYLENPDAVNKSVLEFFTR
jgi:pimeloyl-ACP methyl ester carboxylesterase